MKYLYMTLLLIILHSIEFPDRVLSANDNQLITGIKVFDNDSAFRYLYLYDKLGNKVLETKYFQQDSIWIRNSLNEWIYDGHKCSTQRESIWRDSRWLMTYTINYSYKTDQLVSETHSNYNDGIANLLKKIDYHYVDTTLAFTQEFTRQSGTWIESLETDFSYLPNGMTDSIITTNFQSDNSSSQNLSTFTYNPDGSLQSQLFQHKVGNDWVNEELMNWFYTSNPVFIASVRNKKWVTDTSNWENTQNTDYLYNDGFDLLSETYQHWSTMFWKNDIRYDYLYDNNHNLLKKTLSKNLYNDWRGLISINYSNFIGNKANDIESNYEFWGGNTGDLITSYIPYMFNTNMSIQKGRSLRISYVPEADTTLFVPIESSPLRMIPVYPNPSTGIFYINTQDYLLKSWIITNLKGQVLKRQVQSFQSGVIDLTDLPKGVYILYVTTQDEQLLQKLIIE